MDPSIVEEKYPFLTKEYLEGILRREQRENAIKVESFKVVAPLAKGENYSSDILRVTINYTTGSHNHRTQTYIIKVSFGRDEDNDLLDVYDVFKREIAAYDVVMPKVEQLLSSIGYNKRLAPVAHAIHSTTIKHFVFEDLSLQGYKPVDRAAGLSFSQLQMVLEKVAKFHAATAVLYTIDEESMASHHYRNISEDVPHFYPLFQNSVVACGEQASTWPTTKGRIAEKLLALERTIIAKGCQVYTRNERDWFSVLNHGDLWVNNVMYKVEPRTGKPLDVLLVDYATGFFGSPAIDLSYLLFTSAANDVTVDDFDLLLQHYHAELVDTLTKLKYGKRIPTLLDIQIEMLRKGHNGVMFSTFLIPLRLLEDTANADLGGLLGRSEEAIAFRQRLFSHPRYQDRMEYLLNFYDRKGYLD
ncbi:Juvenile hormone-inducible protein [Anopheles darlingi]|uniref:Juvenile hormone-inducible protein n=1 Tax=Anopheles darlingi TaxID=43151 RepID=W5JA10_ANODA|nr:Juvenile hormone-inducible protein [Anopheles darlingi]